MTGLQARLTTLTSVGRDGVSHLGRELRNFTAAHLSPDGRRVAVIVSDGS